MDVLRLRGFVATLACSGCSREPVSHNNIMLLHKL
jgi:hypothetical protein